MKLTALLLKTWAYIIYYVICLNCLQFMQILNSGGSVRPSLLITVVNCYLETGLSCIVY